MRIRTISEIILPLKQHSEISGETIYIAVTKIEAYTNKYTFIREKL